VFFNKNTFNQFYAISFYADCRENCTYAIGKLVKCKHCGAIKTLTIC